MNLAYKKNTWSTYKSFGNWEDQIMTYFFESIPYIVDFSFYFNHLTICLFLKLVPWKRNLARTLKKDFIKSCRFLQSLEFEMFSIAPTLWYRFNIVGQPQVHSGKRFSRFVPWRQIYLLLSFQFNLCSFIFPKLLKIILSEDVNIHGDL